jgi:peptidoglycan lytic transglycosylase
MGIQAFGIVASALLASTLFADVFLGAAALAGSERGDCPGSSMNATQYSPGRHRASGGPFVTGGGTAAHKTLPFGTKVVVTNPRTGIAVVVTIDDRGPFTRGRDIDLSRGAAQAIGLKDIGRVCTEVL